MFRLERPDLGPGEWMWARIQQSNHYSMPPHAPVVELFDGVDDSEPYARLSVNPPNPNATLPSPDHFWLKDWSENKAIVTALIAAGYLHIDTSVKPIPSGFVRIYAAKIA